MKKLVQFTLVVLLIPFCAACDKFVLAPAAEPLKPEGKIGAMVVERADPLLPYPFIWQFCAYMPDNLEPAVSVEECEVPLVSGLEIAFGWIAKETKFASNWETIAWELSIDGRLIDLASFEWFETVYPAHGEDNQERIWLIELKNLSPGKHTLRISWKSSRAVDDGLQVYQPGTYAHAVNFTVLEKAVYPALPALPEIGQYPYTSEKAGLDFLLHLPDAYGEDPAQKWPLLVYLHGAHLRGATLELLLKEPLPAYVAEADDFPFIVVSPLGDGGYEFWSKEELIDRLFRLLAEIQSRYAIDEQRIYLTGNDMGGNGVWAIGLRHPEYFAALVPIAGYANYPFNVPQGICALKDVPVWAFHGQRDEIVPAQVAQDLVDALQACVGNARLTIHPRMKNDVPYNVYADPGLYEWLLLQARD